MQSTSERLTMLGVNKSSLNFKPTSMPFSNTAKNVTFVANRNFHFVVVLSPAINSTKIKPSTLFCNTNILFPLATNDDFQWASFFWHHKTFDITHLPHCNNQIQALTYFLMHNADSQRCSCFSFKKAGAIKIETSFNTCFHPLPFSESTKNNWQVVKSSRSFWSR